MSKSTTNGLEILKRKVFGEKEKRLGDLDLERVNVEVAYQVYNARKRAGLTQKQLAQKVGTSQSVISRLEDADYGGHSVTMLQRIAKALGQKLDVSIVNGQVRSSAHIATEDKQLDKFEKIIDLCPGNEMRKRDWLPSWETVEELRCSLRCFLGPNPKLAPGRFRLSNQSEANAAALVCWLTKLEIEAERVHLPRFVSRRLKRELGELVHLSASNDGPVKAVEWLEERGVHCIFIRHFSKTYLDGGAMLLGDGRAAIGMTLRHDRLDSFWFTLLHEIAHVLLHRQELLSHPIVDEEIEKQSDEGHETEADTFARNAWVKPIAWRDFRAKTRNYPGLKDIEAFAGDLQVAPALVAGRLRYELNRWKHYTSFLKQGTVASSLEKKVRAF